MKRMVEKANVKGEDISKVRGWMKMIRPTTRPLHHLRQVIVYCGPTALPPALDSFGCFPFCHFACDVDSYSEPVWFVLHSRVAIAVVSFAVFLEMRNRDKEGAVRNLC